MSAQRRRNNDGSHHHATLIRIFGARPETCGQCARIVRAAGGNRDHYKCLIVGATRSETTDWRLKWQACGKFEPAEAPR